MTLNHTEQEIMERLRGLPLAIIGVMLLLQCSAYDAIMIIIATSVVERTLKDSKIRGGV